MKEKAKYLLFAGHHYYPRGGIDDLRADADSIKALEDWFFDNAIIIAKDGGGYIDNWGQIVEYKSMEIVKELKVSK
ncbi:MAG: hypothetical protein IIB73_08390 [Proteobacteria bacterium]|nr:hypothetical protein [Pseudomonadota bacterium]